MCERGGLRVVGTWLNCTADCEFKTGNGGTKTAVGCKGLDCKTGMCERGGLEKDCTWSDCRDSCGFKEVKGGKVGIERFGKELDCRSGSARVGSGSWPEGTDNGSETTHGDFSATLWLLAIIKCCISTRLWSMVSMPKHSAIIVTSLVENCIIWDNPYSGVGKLYLAKIWYRETVCSVNSWSRGCSYPASR